MAQSKDVTMEPTVTSLNDDLVCGLSAIDDTIASERIHISTFCTLTQCKWIKLTLWVFGM